MNIWELDKLLLFIMFIVPGFVCLKTYELLVPSQPRDSSKQLVDAISYSCLNYAFLSPVLFGFDLAELSNSQPILQFVIFLIILFVFPICLAFGWKWLRSTDFVQRNAPHPTAKPWDYVFSQRKSYWIKVFLNDGSIVGGLYSSNSFTSSAPAPEQIYLEQTWIINENGGFERAKNETAGVLILNTEISHIELVNCGGQDG